MANNKALTIQINGDSSDLKKEFDKVKGQTASLEKSLGTIAKRSAVAFAGLTAAVVGVTKTFRTQEQAQIRTVQTIKATGAAAGLTAEQIFTMAQGLQDVTTFGDEAVIQGQNLLLTFRNIGGDVFPRATEAILDMSTAMGTGLKESAIQLGKALNDPILGITALTRVGITFSDEQKDMIRSMQEAGDVAGAQGIILKELEMQFGGVSRAAAEGTGAFIQLGNIIGDVFENIGKNVFVVLAPFIGKLKDLATAVRENEVFASVASKVLIYSTALTGVVLATSTAILVLIQLRKALLLTRLAFIALGVAAKTARARMTLGLSLVVGGVIAFAEQLGGIEVIIDSVKTGFQVLTNGLISGFNNVTIITNEAIISLKELGIAALEAVPGDVFAERINQMKAGVDSLQDSNESLIETNKKLSTSFNDVYDNISAERAAEKVREQEAAVIAVREEAAATEVKRQNLEAAQKIERERKQIELADDLRAERLENDLAVQQIEQELFQAMRDEASNVEITKLQQKLDALKELRDKSLGAEQKKILKNQDEIRKAEEKDLKDRLAFKKKFALDTLDSAVSLGKGLVKEGSAASKALFLIEKASAFASAIVNTSRAITLALASAPPPVNFGLAAAAGAAGAVQIASIASTAIQGAANGALVGDGQTSFSGDRRPFMLEDGELVVPKRNFNEVIDATARSRGFSNDSGNVGGSTEVGVRIDITPEAAQFITATQFENNVLGTDRA